MSVTPTLAYCDLCELRMAAMPGPMFRAPRRPPPSGRRLGYIVEMADGRAHTICSECLASVLAPAHPQDTAHP